MAVGLLGIIGLVLLVLAVGAIIHGFLGAGRDRRG
jgi:hypothetical protein